MKEPGSHFIDNEKLEKLIISYQKISSNHLRGKLLLLEAENRLERIGKREVVNPTVLGAALRLAEEDRKNHKIYSGEMADIKEVLTDVFSLFLKRLVAYAQARYGPIDNDEHFQEGFIVCFDKIQRFDPDHGGRGFNFLTTCVLNHYRQMFRGRKNYTELTKRYFKQIVMERHNSGRRVNKEKHQHDLPD